MRQSAAVGSTLILNRWRPQNARSLPKEDKTMAENKNAVLNDEMMADAAGGKRASGDKKFFVGDRVA